MKKLLFLFLLIPSLLFAAEPKANKIRIDDAGGYFTGTEVETALQELGASAGHDAVTLTSLADKFLSLSTQQIDLQLTDPGADRLLIWDEAPTDGLAWLDYSGWDLTAYTGGDFLTLTGHDFDV